MQIPEKLIQKIKQNNLVVFVGAGLSTKMGYPNWNSLIIDILGGISDKEEKSDKYIQALKDKILEPIEVLTKISEHKTASIEILEKIIRSHDKTQPSSIHEKLGLLTDKIITTNYDSLLEKALPEFEQISYSNQYKVAKLSQYDQYIFKIHGDIQEPHKCVLFPSEYDLLYDKEEKTSTFELKKIISNQSILFIGFSLNDPYISHLFEYITNLYSGFNPDHYILTTENKKSWPKNINPIVLDDYNSLENCIDKLIESKDKTSKDEKEFQEELTQKSDSPIIKFSENHEYDSPPNNKYWVGRNREIDHIASQNFKAIFITGIGGQGKSALAAHYLRNYFDTDSYEFGDWRDFKEEANRFQTKFISIVKRLSPDFKFEEIESLNNRDLVDTFFKVLGKRKIIFVFDNIDNYIDLETFTPAGSFDYLLNQIMNKGHNSKFVFTCRPFIREAGVGFYQIQLDGLSQEECFELFKLYKISIKKSQLKLLSNKAHKITKGHPLWLNLIAGQAIRGVETVYNFIDKIENKSSFDEDDFSSILSSKILDEVWKSLNDNQKTLIRGIAETVKPETEENLKEILQTELKPNRFNRALKTLKNLNLVEFLSGGEIELHPLVKEYVLTKYPKNERAKFITLFVKYYDRFIYILKPNLSSNLTIQDFQNWTSKIELQINKNDFKSALIALEEVGKSILAAGYTEEYLRVAEKLYEAMSWETAVNGEFSYFHSQINLLFTTQTQMGKFDVSLRNLENYSKLIPGKSSHYLSYCSEKTYNLWYQKKFDEAIQNGEEGEFLLNESSLADQYSLKHNLALARRDSGDKVNVEKALNFFLQNELLDEVLDKTKINKELSGNFYGNVGKCLEILEEEKNSLFCYCVSFRLLLTEDSTNSILNIGYACSWIGQLLIKSDKKKDGLYFLKYAMNSWEATSPPRYEETKKIYDKVIFDKETKKQINNLSAWRLEDFCKKYISKIII
ncbi:NB-ARC domain-containing protein [Salegentibacter sp. 24]|uniref:SIR2 family protein n=1 Tax=Salegentibacter sp. 24 TaxID=2183986 RepID=UPI001060A894|nr:SIR2 family protein [Salegentibacter sp. 24]TDN79364.1 NB-ARC domain-containing protein [Salegentibacter sp. 24]